MANYNSFSVSVTDCQLAFFLLGALLPWGHAQRGSATGTDPPDDASQGTHQQQPAFSHPNAGPRGAPREAERNAEDETLTRLLGAISSWPLTGKEKTDGK